MSRHSCPLLMAVLVGAPTALAWAQQRIDDPVPADARGAVLAISGEVRTIGGLSGSVAGRVDPLAAALQDLAAQATESEIHIELAADVLFDFDRAELKPEAEAALTKVGTVLDSYPAAAVTIEGHTDGKGTDAYNQGLSERRAEAVVKWLRSRQAARREGTLTARGRGASRPLAPNRRPDGTDDAEGRRRNRRVEIVVQR